MCEVTLKQDAVIFAVDDDASVLRANTRSLITAGWRVESFLTAKSLLERPGYDGVGCVLADLHMPEMSGLDLQMALSESGYTLPIIFLSGEADIPSTVRALKAGAVDFLVKPLPVAVLLQAVESAITRHGEILAESSEIRELQDRWDRLTPREKEVANGVARGLMNKQIAAELEAAEATVKIHRGRVMIKLGAPSVPDLLRIMLRIQTE